MHQVEPGVMLRQPPEEGRLQVDESRVDWKQHLPVFTFSSFGTLGELEEKLAHFPTELYIHWPGLGDAEGDLGKGGEARCYPCQSGKTAGQGWQCVSCLGPHADLEHKYIYIYGCCFTSAFQLSPNVCFSQHELRTIWKFWDNVVPAQLH